MGKRSRKAPYQDLIKWFEDEKAELGLSDNKAVLKVLKWPHQFYKKPNNQDEVAILSTKIDTLGHVLNQVLEDVHAAVRETPQSTPYHTGGALGATVDSMLSRQERRPSLTAIIRKALRFG
jgi:hypothetical protein